MKRFICTVLVMSILLTGVWVICVNAATGQDVVDEARRWIGTPYGHSDGSGGPGSLVDCSGLTLQVYKKFGYSLEWSTYSQVQAGVAVPYTVGNYSNLQPGDLIFMNNTSHVGIYS